MTSTRIDGYESSAVRQSVIHLAIEGFTDDSLKLAEKQLTVVARTGDLLELAITHRLIGLVVAKQTIHTGTNQGGSTHAALALAGARASVVEAYFRGEEFNYRNGRIEIGRCYRAIGLIAAVDSMQSDPGLVTEDTSMHFDDAAQLMVAAPEADLESNSFARAAAKALTEGTLPSLRLVNPLLLRPSRANPENRLIHNILYDMQHQSALDAAATATIL